jgi:PilZ domain
MDVPDHPTTAPSMAAVKRETNRESMFLLVTVRFEGVRDPISARVRNISVGGMMIDSAVIRQKGHRIVAELKNIGEVTGHVAWSTETRMGIAFDEEIDPKLARQPVGVAPKAPAFLAPINGRRPGLNLR